MPRLNPVVELSSRVAACAAVTLALAAVAGAGDTSYVVSPGPTINASFQAPDARALTLSFRLDPSLSRAAMTEFGYTDTEVKAIYDQCSADGCGPAEVTTRIDTYYRTHGFVPRHLSTGTVSLTVDMPGMVRRNGARVRPVASAVESLARSKGYSAEAELGAVVAFIQTAMVYRRPPISEGGRQIAGFYPPPRALEVGAGDCDTKSALLAAVVSNFSASHMVGVHVPGHYLVGIGRIPHSGDAFVTYRGEPYVLIEASGPGYLPPGVISAATQSALKVMTGVRIDPLF